MEVGKQIQEGLTELLPTWIGLPDRRTFLAAVRASPVPRQLGPPSELAEALLLVDDGPDDEFVAALQVLELIFPEGAAWVWWRRKNSGRT